MARRLGSQIASELRTDILTGRLAEGELLQETILAERFGTSRGPVRDALLELSKEGMVVARPSRGVTVAGSPPDSIQNLVLPIRRTIECHALEIVFDSLGPPDWQIWDDILEKMRRACAAQDYSGIVEQDIALHRSLIERAGQPDLVAIWTTILARVRRDFIEQCQSYADPMEHYDEHMRLIAALKSKDKAAAMRALEVHIIVDRGDTNEHVK